VKSCLRGDDVGKEDTTGDTAEPYDPVLGGVVVEILGSLERGEEDPLGGDVGVEDSRDDEGGKTESVGDPLDERSSATEGGRGDVLSTVVVDLEGNAVSLWPRRERSCECSTYDSADDNVKDSGETVAEQKRTSVELGVPHFGHDGQAVDTQAHQRLKRQAGQRVDLLGGSSSVGETELTYSAHGSSERGGRGNSEVLVECARGCRGRPVRDTDGDGNEEERDDQTECSCPGDPGDLVQSLNRGQEEDKDGSDGNKDGGAGTVQGHGVESDGNGQKSGTSDGRHP
jgi:hypothetical protein